MRTPTVVRQSWGSREVRAMLPSPTVEQVPFPAAADGAATGSSGLFAGNGALFDPSNGSSCPAQDRM
jgi:hypothetical protein